MPYRKRCLFSSTFLITVPFIFLLTFLYQNVFALFNVNQLQSETLPGTVIVKFADDINIDGPNLRTGASSINEKIEHYQVSEIKQAFPFLKNSNLKGAENLTKIYYFKFPTEFDPKEVDSNFHSDITVEYAEPKYIHYMDVIPNDPSWPQQGELPQIVAPNAWDLVKGDTGDVVIAIVDNGTDWQHPDLTENVWQNLGEDSNGNGSTLIFSGSSWIFDPDDENGVDDDGNGKIDDFIGWNFVNDSNDPNQGSDHGTLVTGCAAGVTNNGLGIASISWNSRFMPIDVGDENISYGYDGIVYATNENADIINCSWGRSGAFSQYEQNIINFAYNNGTLVVASAGNGGPDGIGDNNDDTPHYPSNYIHVLGVGATNKTNDIKTVFSNYGAESVDVFAPGASILTPIPGGGYNYVDGTSFSSPIVAGLSGLVKTKFPIMSPDELTQRIKFTCDNIDSLNPQFAGFLGSGRVNAYQAVDSNYPVLRVTDVMINDSGGNGLINPGEIIDIDIKITSYYTNVSNVIINLAEDDDYVTLTNSVGSIVSLDQYDTTVVSFQFTTNSSIPDGHVIQFVLNMSVGTYNISDYFKLTAFADYLTHDTGVLQVSITSEGNIGFTGFGEGQSAGEGFVYKNSNYLYEGGIMIGNGIATISDCIRGTNPQIEDADFRPATGEFLSITSPGSRTYEEGSILLVDSLALAPIGISVLQQSYADTNSRYDDFVIMKYSITNLRSSVISNLHVGLFMDWNVNAGRIDCAAFDTSRSMSIVRNLPSSASRFMATKLLTHNGNVSYRSINNETELNDGFNILEKWNFLTGGIQTTDIILQNVSTLLSAGPFTLSPNESVEVAYALLAAYSQTELEATADTAQALWDGIITHISGKEMNNLPDKITLYQNYPNPFNPWTNIEFSIGKKSQVNLSIYNLLGQKIRTLVNAVKSPDVYTIIWDGKDDNGIQVASGIYIYKLTSSKNSISRKMVLVR